MSEQTIVARDCPRNSRNPQWPATRRAPYPAEKARGEAFSAKIIEEIAEGRRGQRSAAA